MHRPSAYDRSQETLVRLFVPGFHSVPVKRNIYCCPIVEETMLNDGCFVDAGTGNLFAFDWEIRKGLQSFAPNDFPYPTLTEFARKFAAEKHTQLIIQCDNQQKYIAVAWREDFLNSNPAAHRVVADYGKQNAIRYETPHFKVYPLSDLTEFKIMVSRALETGTYNHSVF